LCAASACFIAIFSINLLYQLILNASISLQTNDQDNFAAKAATSLQAYGPRPGHSLPSDPRRGAFPWLCLWWFYACYAATLVSHLSAFRLAPPITTSIFPRAFLYWSLLVFYAGAHARSGLVFSYISEQCLSAVLILLVLHGVCICKCLRSGK